jgi:hypothetical protein
VGRRDERPIPEDDEEAVEDFGADSTSIEHREVIDTTVRSN